VAFHAGAVIQQGRAFDGQTESMGSFIHLGGIENATEEQKAAAKEKLREAMADDQFRFYSNGFTGSNDMHLDHFSPNMTRWPGDSTNARDLTQAEIGVREQVWKLWQLLKAQPGFENCYIQATSQVGPRESRQVIGDYVLTGDDVHNGSKFPDAVARGSWWVDIHCPLGNTYPVHLCVIECPRQEACPFWAAEHATTMRAKADLYPPDDDWYDIPYRCLTPQKIDNLLVSGRCISATHQGMAGARVMGTCIAIGEAAGAAAALAVRDGVNPRDIDVPTLRQMLQDAGALL
ncbi:MAG: FAD-dependent oxidoreductase, partial [Anaerolineae bacterium]